MWAIACAWAGEQTVEVEEAKAPRGSFEVSAGLSAGRVEGEILPVASVGAAMGYELGRQRGHLLRTEFDMLAMRDLSYRRVALGWSLVSPEAPVRLLVGPRLWMAELLVDDVSEARSPGLSLSAGLFFDLGQDWTLEGALEGGRGLGPAWVPLGPLPITHASASLGVRSPIGFGLGVGVQQIGSTQTGLLTFGVVF